MARILSEISMLDLFLTAVKGNASDTARHTHEVMSHFQQKKLASGWDTEVAAGG